MTDLEEIDGVGPATAETLEEEGYETAEDVADGNAEDFDELVPSSTGQEIITNARGEVQDGDDESTGDVFEFGSDLNVDQRNYLLRGLLEEETKARRVNNADKVGRIKESIQEVVDGEPYRLTLDQLGDAYTGVNQLEQDLLHDRNITSFVSEIREVRNLLKDAREDMWPDNEN